MSEPTIESLIPGDPAWSGPVAGVPATGQSLAAALAEAEHELIACQRLALLGSLAAMAMHEFNNLLTPVVTRVEAALADGDPALTRKALERTLVQAQRAIALNRRLLELAHQPYRSTEMCSVSQAVREALETTARPFEKDGIELRVTVPEELRVCASADLLCQVLLNLVLNARQAMKDTRGGILSIAAREDGENVIVEVRDTGRGIPAAQIESVFNPFLAADPWKQPGDWERVGLGLSVCRLIAHLHGATLRAEANPDRGCTFRLWWPKRPPHAVS